MTNAQNMPVVASCSFKFMRLGRSIYLLDIYGWIHPQMDASHITCLYCAMVICLVPRSIFSTVRLVT